MKKEIVAINKLKKTFGHKDLKDFSVLKKLQQAIRKETVLKDLPIIKAFINDIDNYIKTKGKSRFHELKSLINNRNDNFIFSIFTASYFPDLSIDGFF